MIVVTIARVLDRVLAASMRAPLKQAQLANEPRIVGQPRQTAREHRQAFEVDGAFRPRTADVLKTELAPCASNPVPCIIVASQAANAIPPAPAGVFLRPRLRVELAASPANHIDDVDIPLLVPDRDGIRIRATAGDCCR